MRLNIFRIPNEAVTPLREKVSSVGMTLIREVDQAGWHGDFYFSEDPRPGTIPWAATYAEYFAHSEPPTNRTYFAVFLFIRGR